MVRHQAAERESVRKRLKKKDGRAAGERDFYRRWKRRLAYARALPDTAGAKPGGANTTPEITNIIRFYKEKKIILLYLLNYSIYLL